MVAKCEAEFVSKLSRGRLGEYRRAQSRCSRKYRHESGTMYRSFEAHCAAEVARSHAGRLPKTRHRIKCEGDEMLASIQMVLIIVAAAAAAAVATKHVVGRARDAAALAIMTIALGLPLWITCDHYLLKILPTVLWFDPREPFAPYFLLYLPLSIVLAVTPAAAFVAIARLCARRIRQGEQGSAGD